MSGQSVLARHDTRRAVYLPDLLQQQVSAQPDATAVTGGGERLSYRQLGDAAGVLGAQLYHLGVRADDCVGQYVEPSLELMGGPGESCTRAPPTCRCPRSTPPTGSAT